MKIYKTLLFSFANILAAQSFYLKENNEIIAYRPVIPKSLKQIAKDAINHDERVMFEKVKVDLIEKDYNAEVNYMKSETSQPFKLNVICDDEKPKCDNFSKFIREGTNYVANTFEIYNTINVEVTIFSFCNYFNDPSCKNTVGKNYPPTYLKLIDKDNEATLFPTALVKQNENINYDGFDLYVCLNSDRKLTNDEIVFLTVHEIIHGLGFTHSMHPITDYTNHVDKIMNSITNNFVIPSFQNDENNKSLIINNWLPFTAFDKHIVATSKPKELLYKRLEKFMDNDLYVTLPKDATAKQQTNFINELQRNKEAYNIGSEIYKIFTTADAVGFRTNDGTIVKLQSFNGNYVTSTSICHTNVPNCKKYPCDFNINNFDQNYLMYYGMSSPLSINNLINKFKNVSNYDLIGNDIIKILNTLGWKEKTSFSKNVSPVKVTTKKTTTTKKTASNTINIPISTSTVGRCGPDFGACPKAGQCCSRYGYCGTTPEYCGPECQNTYGKCD